MIKGKKKGKDDSNYTKIPNCILKAKDLSSEAVRVLALMIDRQSALDNKGKLFSGGSFYMVASAFDEMMDISGTQVQKRILPELEKKGLLKKWRCPLGADTLYKQYNFYYLDWDKIYGYDGSQKDPQKEAMKKEKGRKAQETLRFRKINPCVAGKEKFIPIIAQRFGYDSVVGMMHIDWSEPEDENEYRTYVSDRAKTIALHRSGYIIINEDEYRDTAINAYMKWSGRSEEYSRYEFEEAIKKYEQVIKRIETNG